MKDQQLDGRAMEKIRGTFLPCLSFLCFQTALRNQCFIQDKPIHHAFCSADGSDGLAPPADLRLQELQEAGSSNTPWVAGAMEPGRGWAVGRRTAKLSWDSSSNASAPFLASVWSLYLQVRVLLHLSGTTSSPASREVLSHLPIHAHSLRGAPPPVKVCSVCRRPSTTIQG